MSYETQPGYPYSPRFRILDANGSPIVSGIVGTLTVYGPENTALTSGSLAHLGDGWWGYNVAGSFLTARGTYRWSTGAITGTATLSAQSGTFVVGVGNLLSLREVLTRVRRGVRDGETGTTSATGSTTTLVCKRFAWGSPNNWLRSEIFLFEPQSLTDLNPVRVTGFTESSGTFTFANQAITSTITGLDFIIGDKEGQGYTHDEVMDAITGAIQRAGILRPVNDQYAVTAANNTFEYPIDAAWVGIDTVEYRQGGDTDALWRPLARPFWQFYRERGALRLTQEMGGNTSIRIIGRALPVLPATMGELVQADGMAIRDDALFELLQMSEEPGDRQRAAMLGPSVMQARRGAMLARL